MLEITAFHSCGLIFIQSPVVGTDIYRGVFQEHCHPGITLDRLNVALGLNKIITRLWTWVLIPCRPPFSKFVPEPKPSAYRKKQKVAWDAMVLSAAFIYCSHWCLGQSLRNLTVSSFWWHPEVRLLYIRKNCSYCVQKTLTQSHSQGLCFPSFLCKGHKGIAHFSGLSCSEGEIIWSSCGHETQKEVCKEASRIAIAFLMKNTCKRRAL